MNGKKVRKMKEKILCIHHNDSDGKLAAAIVKRHCLREHIDHDIIEVGYNDYKEKLDFVLNEEKVPIYNKVYILDFSMGEREMHIFLKYYTVIWCDHHKTAMEKLPKLWKDSALAGIRNMDKCGAMLTWEYFSQVGESFEELRLVDDYDRWQHKLGDDSHWFAELNKNWSVEQWVDVINKTSTGKMISYLEKGKFLFELKLKRIEETMKKGIPVIFNEKKSFIVNNTNTMDGSLLGNKICEQGYDIAIKFEFVKEKVIFGLNSIGELDVSLIAKRYGGGGHKNASGFVILIEQFSHFFDSEFKLKKEKEDEG